MHKLFLLTRHRLSTVQVWLTGVHRWFACYLIPAGIASISLVALFSWHNQYNFSGNLPLDVRVVAGDATIATPAAALAALGKRAPAGAFSTHLAETPFWFSVDTVHRMAGPEVIEFPSRHAVDIACWDTAGMALLGAATKNTRDETAFQALAPAKAGFALRLAFVPSQLLCRALFSGPGRLSVVQWPADQFALSTRQYHRKSGLLDGGMIVLALFVLIIAAVHREAVYVLFAGWVMLNLRLFAISTGWDVQWLGQLVPSTWLLVSRNITVVLYGISTLALYQMLFREQLAQPRQRVPLRIVQWLCLPMLAAGLVLPAKSYVPIIWVVVVLAIFLLTADLARVVVTARTRVAAYFAAALAISFAVGLSEIVAGVFDLRELADIIDNATAALASSLLAALAVAEQMRLEREHRIVQQAGLRQNWDAVPAALFTLDMDGRFLAANPALAAMLGSAAIGAGAMHWEQFFTADAWRRFYQLLAARQAAELELVQPAQGRRFLVRATLAHDRIVGVLEDITEHSREVEQLRYLAHHDALTGVVNRRGLEPVFDAAASALAAGRPMALAFLDFDRFKLINELYGRAAGDEVLRQACERITALLAAGQHLARIGGDAFIVAMADTSMQMAAATCRGIVERVGKTPYLVGDKAFSVHASLGLVEVTRGMPMADAIAGADRACRDARAAGSPGLLALDSDDGIREAYDTEKKLLARLACPNATEGLFLEMQPILALAAPHASLSVEVLLRMRDADGGVVDAQRILDAAEKSGRAGVIDRWVLATTLDWIERHAGQLATTHFVCMRLSGASLNDEQFVHTLLGSLRRYAHVAPRLCLAIAERVALPDLDNTRRFIERVRAFGVKIALDEFGAGSSPFSYLQALPADLLKIDSRFVAGLAAHPGNAAIVEAIVHLAGNLGMKTISGAAHDSATVRILARVGIDYVQGDAVARAQTPDAIVAARSSASFVNGGDWPGLRPSNLSSPVD